MSSTTLWIICAGGIGFVLGVLVEMFAEYKIINDIRNDFINSTDIENDMEADELQEELFNPW